MHRAWIGAALLVLLACDSKKDEPKLPEPPKTPATPPKPEPPAVKGPDRVTVQHILIGFSGTVDKESVTRTKEEAEKLAATILDRVKRGEDFDNLVRQYSDDNLDGNPRGAYMLFNDTNGAQRADPEEHARSSFIPAFCDVAFSLQVGQIGIVQHDEVKSRYGWHIIKRIK